MNILPRRKSPISEEVLTWGLLLLNGLLISLMLALAKTATSQGLPAASYAFWQTLIAGTLLLVFSGGQKKHFSRQLTRYFIVSGLTGIAIPNLIAFYLVTRLGAGFTGIMYALPPLFTFLLALILRLEKPVWTRFAGLGIAVLACSWIVSQRHAEMGLVSPVWFGLGLLIPLMLSIGNLYRSIAWPKHAKPTTLAAGTLLTSSLALAVFAGSTGTELLPDLFDSNMFLILALQGGLTALTYLCAFELQKRSNPVFYSQLGVVAALFGLMIGALWFKESYTFGIWIGALFVVLGLKLGARRAEN
ncbi:DMT family transporter [Saccharophagus degradans]|uniref:DMT family transporter n=1 Tax=Saccharophagus degradans TaxID=86304 RepID=A0AAW7X6E2_9GAMM|nr:DMT family transporter [Saccharophagus degradans]MDO6422453.1 DMT family transporter [Saccharophagus degradans]MDO6606934.1 DMT family transporter [Saccharophagus degradans]